MRLLVNGFNLYGQLPAGGDKNVVEKFKDFPFSGAFKEKYPSKIEVRHTFCALLVGNQLYMLGAGYSNFTHIMDKVVDFSSCDSKIIAVTSRGNLIKIAKNDISTLVKVPSFAVEDNVVKINKISCGAKLTVAVTNSAIYNIPNRLDFNLNLEQNKIVDLKCGREHCLLLVDNGDVYSLGAGSRGQLGHGCLDDSINPTLIKALAGLQVVAIAVGGWHSCALTQNGDLYTWGWNCCKQLGLTGDNDHSAVIATPRLVDLEGNVKMVACGSKHTVILMESGALGGCGWNKYKQLGEDGPECYNRMTALGVDLSCGGVMCLGCGPWNSFVVME